MSETRGAEKLIEPIYDAALAPERWPGFLESLAPRLGASGLYLILRYPDEHDPGALFTAGTDPRFDEAYREHYWRKDPWRPLAHQLPEGTVGCGQGLLSEEELVRTAFYNEWMLPQGYHHSFGAVLELRAGLPRASLTAFQPKSADLPDARQLELLKALFPHLQRALLVDQQLRESEMRRIGASEALDRVAGGVIVLDQHGRPLDVNRAGEDLLAARDGLYLDRDGPSASASEETEALRRLVAESARGGAGRGRTPGGALAVTRPSGRPPLQVVVSPIGRESSPLFDRRAVAALFVSDPELHQCRPPDRLRHLYGLTRTEAEVASRLTGGHRLEEIAKELGVSVHTARGHLKQIFAKTGTRRQADLVRVMLSGPAALRVG